MYCHGLISLLTLARVVSLSLKSNVAGTPPPLILVDNDARVERSSIHDEFTEGLYQGDIMLTEEQRWELLSRKVIANSAQWWPRSTSAGGGVDIDYRFADNTINRAGVRIVLDYWQQATCIRFNEIPADVSSAHLIFTHSTSCTSSVGRVSAVAGQVIKLSSSCITGVGSAIHEVGHSLGLYHEQSRSDRDDYVSIISSNIMQSFMKDFNKEVDNNFSVPYDYSSVMHFAATAFSTNGNTTILPKNFGALPLIGQRKALSFLDIKIVNLQYQCIDDWLAACVMFAEPCQNLGYTTPGCTCACPAGTSGGNCETLINNYTDALIAIKSPDSLLVTTETDVTSPKFPAPIQTELAYVQTITAPLCYTVKITFNTFDFSPTSLFGGSQRCYLMTLEIRTDDPPTTGTKYCETSIVPGAVFQSAGRTMLLLFSSYANSGSYTGYSATVQFVMSTDLTCGAPEPSTSTTTPTTTTSTTTTPTTTTSTTTTPTTTTTTPTTTTSTTTTPTTTTPTTTTPLGCTVTNTGNVPLLASLTGSCQLNTVSATTFNLVSPNYPSRYSSLDACNGWFSTIEPRYVRVTPVAVDISLWDQLSFKQVHQNVTKVNNALMGRHLVFPSSSSTSMSFFTGGILRGNKFSFNMEVVNSKCHQIINIPTGATCTLSIPTNYPRGTICEWWIKAPPGKKVRVTFSRFNVGNKLCLEDFMDIDTTGDSRYISATRYCGNNLQMPGTVTSKSNQINILMNGRDGNFGGFDATYTAV